MTQPMRPFVFAAALATVGGFVFTAAAQATSDGNAIQASRLGMPPVKEVTIYKDGHAFVAHEGRLPVHDGQVVIDHLPQPILGTFWAYSADKAVKLSAVSAGPRLVGVERTALSLFELLLANPGAAVTVTEVDKPPYAATLVGIPERSTAELQRTDPPGSPPRPPERGNLCLLRTAEGLRTVPLERLRDITFHHEPQPRYAQPEQRPTLSLRLDWNGQPATADAAVGMVYVQRGLRWIPSYRMDIDGQGKARVELQATLINEMVDLHEATAHLVIGVPSFLMTHTIDPIALQDTFAQLSQYFGQSAAGQQVAGNFSNAVQVQTARMGEYRGGVPPTPEGVGGAAADLEGSRSEDLFIFTVPKVTLRRGDRMVLPVATFTLDYSDVYKLDLPIAPPAELREPNERDAELSRLLGAPKVKHSLRLKNTSAYPLTTAPALILREGRILAQGLMTYTSVGADSDLEVTAAVDIQVNRSEREVGRTQNAEKWDNDHYHRVDLEGTIHLCNHRAKPVEIEVRRYVIGHPDRADRDGKAEKINAYEEDEAEVMLPRAASAYRYNWPYWWNRYNGFGKFTWKVKLAPGEAVDLTYTWHYFWR